VVYQLKVVEGSGWKEANWLLILTISETGLESNRVHNISSFKTAVEAHAERAIMIRDLALSSSERG